MTTTPIRYARNLLQRKQRMRPDLAPTKIVARIVTRNATRRAEEQATPPPDLARAGSHVACSAPTLFRASHSILHQEFRYDCRPHGAHLRRRLALWHPGRQVRPRADMTAMARNSAANALGILEYCHAHAYIDETAIGPIHGHRTPARGRPDRRRGIPKCDISLVLDNDGLS